MIKKFIALVAGRSGGHIIPGMTYAEQYKKMHPDIHVLFFSTDYHLDKAIIDLYPWIDQYVPLSLVNFPGINIFRYPLFIFQFIKCFFISCYNLYTYAPGKIVSMGGYISIPVALAGWLMAIPVELFELNAVPGRAAYQIARFASKINVCFAQAQKYFPEEKTHFVSYPLRFNKKENIGRLAACNKLMLDPSKKVLLVLGGSQGSRFINKLLKELSEHYFINHQDIQIIHQTGALDVEPLQLVYQKHNIVSHVFDYKHDLQLCYEAADLVIARAGAGTLFELAFFEKLAIIIPLETKITDHQLDNAYAMQEMHPELFTVVRQQEIEHSIGNFYQKIKI